LKSRILAPADGQTLQRRTRNVSDNRTSDMPCQHAIHSRLQLMVVLRRVQAPLTVSVFEVLY